MKNIIEDLTPLGVAVVKTIAIISIALFICWII